MQYEICARCHEKKYCVGIQSNCERWKIVYKSMEEELHELIDDYHRAYTMFLEEEHD